MKHHIINGIENCRSRTTRDRAEQLEPKRGFRVAVEDMNRNQALILYYNLIICGGTLLADSSDSVTGLTKTITYYAPMQFAGVMRLKSTTRALVEVFGG